MKLSSEHSYLPSIIPRCPKYTEFFATHIQSLINEALNDYVEVSVASRWDVWTETMRRNDRAENRAEKRREEDAIWRNWRAN